MVTVALSLMLAAAWGQDAPDAQAVPDAPRDTMSIAREARVLADLDVGDDLVRPVDNPIHLDLGPIQVTLDNGYVVPILSGAGGEAWQKRARAWRSLRIDKGEADLGLPTEEELGSRELVGIAWVGEGAQVELSLDDRGEGLIFANRMVHDLGQPREVYADIAAGTGPFRTTADKALFLGVQPQLLQAFLTATDLPDDPESTDEEEVYRVVVISDKAAARRTETAARQMLRERVGLWQELGVDVAELIALDRVNEVDGLVDAQGRSAWAELHTDTTWGRYVEEGRPTGPWLGVIRQDDGWFDPRRRWTVLNASEFQGVETFGYLGGEPFPGPDGDPDGPPTPLVGMTTTSASAVARVLPHANAQAVEVQIDVALTVKAYGGAVGSFLLDVPWVESVFGTWELEVLDAEGRVVDVPLGNLAAEARAVDIVGTEDATQGLEEGVLANDLDAELQIRTSPKATAQVFDPRAGRRTATIHLVEPLPEGASTTLTVKLVDTWPYGQMITFHHQDTKGMTDQSGQTDRAVQAGVGTGSHPILPAIHGDPELGTWSYDVTAQVASSLKLGVAVSGRTLSERDGEGYVETRAAGELERARLVELGMGRWADEDEPAYKDLPATRVHLFPTNRSSLGTFGPEIRRVVTFYQRWLPALPFAEVEVMESPGTPTGFLWTSPHGQITVSQFLSDQLAGGLRKVPRLEQGLFAHELAHQYWGHAIRAATLDDAWVMEAIAEASACTYLASAFSPEVCTARMRQARRRWEGGYLRKPWLEPVLVGAYRSPPGVDRVDVLYQLGPYVMQEMLRKRIGSQAFFTGLGRLYEAHAGEPITTAMVEQFLEAESGRDLTDFFDYWVFAGQIPALDLAWHSDDDRTTGRVTTDLPFGRFDVPVVVVTPDGDEEVWVDVVDGVGTFSLRQPAKKVQLDPDGMVLARARTEHRVAVSPVE